MTKFILKEVNRLVKKYKTRDPFEIAEMMKINVCYHELGTLKGYYFYQSKFRYIVINKNIKEELFPIICAHELGHDRFHQSFAKNDPIREFSLFQTCICQKIFLKLFLKSLNLLSETELLYH